MFHTDPSSRDDATGQPEDPSTQAESVPHDSGAEGVDEPPASSSWQAVAPWGTPGNHLTGPIPRIRKRRDGSLTHDEES
ncbi:hypothetical protein [Mobilicoccus massiliensis]|uniref:hypothetical protein n=1 Tax=Mobilicoccus massiliensis TaxID=1522310 RepID=UPI00058D8CC1|nr:hypothetical protein [Mobilicoccus massiliensis]